MPRGNLTRLIIGATAQGFDDAGKAIKNAWHKIVNGVKSDEEYAESVEKGNSTSGSPSLLSTRALIISRCLTPGDG